MFIAGDSPLNANFLLTSMAIHFKKPLGNLGRT